jgi:hypothetical protein
MSETTELIAQQILNGNINKRTWGDILYNVKVYGAKGDGSDDTAAIQKAINAAIAANSKLVFFPTGTYSATALTGLDQVTLVGNNVTLAVGADMVEVEQLSGVSGLKSKASAMYARAIEEISTVPYNSMLQARSAIALRGELRVMFFGDSITEGGDTVNDEERYASVIEQEIRNSFTSINLTIANYALGGRNLYLATSPTYLGAATEPANPNDGFYRSWSTVGMSWMDSVKNFRPDIIILAFGMNDASGVGTDYNFSFYADYFKSIIDTWATVPSVVVVPTFVQSASHGGSVLSQRITQALARATRYWGIDNGYYVADVNRLYNILINGTEDVTRVGRREIDFEGYPALWSGDKSSFTLSSGVLTPNVGVTNKNVTRDFNFYNGTIEMTFKQSATVYDGSLAVNYRNDSTFGAMHVFVFGGADGFVQLLYDGGVISTSGTVNIPLNTNHTFKLVVNGSSHKVYINGVLVLSTISYRCQHEGGIVLGRGTTGTPPIISNLKLSAMDQIETIPLYSELDLLGKYNSPESGGAINHPNGLGHAMMYVPAFNGVLNQLTSVKRENTTKSLNALTYYVDPALGLDTNDGLSSSTPLKTITALIRRIPDQVDHNIVINAAAGTYDETVNFNGFSGKGKITLNGSADLAGAINYKILSAIVSNCRMPIVISGFRFTDGTVNVAAGLIKDSTNAVFKFCDTVVVAGGKYGFLFTNSQGQVDTCLISGRYMAIDAADQSTVTSIGNTGTGNDFGLASFNASKIGKSGSQPAGTTAEYITGGGTIS